VQEHSYTAGEGTSCARISPDEKSFFVLDERRLRLVSTQTGEVGEIELPESPRFLSAAFNAVGNRLAFHLSDGNLAILETAHGRVVDQVGSSILAIDHPVPFGFARDDLVVIGDMGLRTMAAQNFLNHPPAGLLSPQRYSWTVFSSTQQLIDMGRALTTSCIAPNERRSFSLPDEPPDWCVELRKQPYQSPEWQSWLEARRRKANPPLPTSPD
jgi:hypothetical protein